MQAVEADHDRFVHLIYEAAEDATRWREFYEAIRLITGSESVHMLALDHQRQTLSYSDGANLPVEGELAYIQRYRFIDPRMPLIMGASVQEWIHCHQHLDEAFVAQDPFHQEFLLPYNRRYMTACKLVDGKDATVIFSTLRTPAQGPMPEAGVAFLNRLLPHLARATRMGLRNFVHSTQAMVGQMLVSRLRQPVILMTPGGDVIHANEAARHLLSSTDLVRIVNGKVRLAGHRGGKLIERCCEIEGFFKAGDPRADMHRGRFENIEVAGNRGGSDTLYAFFTLLPPQEVMGTFGLRPVVMLVFYHPDSAPSIDSSLLYAVFGLTPAESRIASMLAEGLSLKEIAAAQGTKLDTVRKQLRAIFQKTSTNRQPELVRLLLHLPHHVLQSGGSLAS